MLVLFSCSNDPYSDNYEQGEEYSGGTAATVFDFGTNAFSHQVPGLSGEEETWFAVGNSFFKQNWVTAPSSTAGRDGLGPLMNAFSCSGCHLRDGRGQPETFVGPSTSALLFRLSIPGTDIHGGPLSDPVYGGQFQNMSIEGVQSEGTVTVAYDQISGQYADGGTYQLRKPVYIISGSSGGYSGMVSPRIAQQVMGLGLLEAIANDDILANEDPSDADGNGISGRANYVWDRVNNTLSIGRFGWKANQPSIIQQVAAAFAGDIGITSSLFTVESCTSSQLDCQGAPNGNDAPSAYELSDYQLGRVAFYMASLAVPGRRNATDQQVLRGKEIFLSIGCAGCHTPSYTTGAYSLVSSLGYQKIYPYTDLLLHDMGEGLADGAPDYLATGNEWRTPPLWGIGLVETVNGHTTFLHDGRARNLEEAILWHGGEAQPSNDLFHQLSKDERTAVLKFLESL